MRAVGEKECLDLTSLCSEHQFSIQHMIWQPFCLYKCPYNVYERDNEYKDKELKPGNATAR